MSVCRAETRQFITDCHFCALSSLTLSPAAREAIVSGAPFSLEPVQEQWECCWGVDPCHLSTLYWLCEGCWAAGLLDPEL